MGYKEKGFEVEKHNFIIKVRLFSKQPLYLFKNCMDMLSDYDNGHKLYFEKKGVKPYSDTILKGSGAILSYF
jgi:hypothetical protein